MQRLVTPEQRQAARREIARQVEQGASSQEARASLVVPMHRTTVYRLLKRVQSEGENAFTDGRHGHPIKLRGEALTCVIEHCQRHPAIASSAVQQRLSERFGLSISISQREARASRPRSESPACVTRKKSPKPALRLRQDITNRRAGCSCWRQPLKLDCSHSWSKHCQLHQTLLAFPWQVARRCADVCC